MILIKDTNGKQIGSKIDKFITYEDGFTELYYNEKLIFQGVLKPTGCSKGEELIVTLTNALVDTEHLKKFKAKKRKKND